MRLRKSWPFLVYFSFFVLLVAASIACGPPVGTGTGNDGNSQSEGGSNTEGIASETNPDASSEPTNPDGTAESTNPDGIAESTNPDGTAESTNPDGTAESTNPDGTAESTNPDGTAESTNPDGTAESTPESTGDAIPEGKTRCEQQNGYCELFPNDCKPNYQNDGDPLDCPGGRSAICCQPTPTPPQCTTDKDCPTTCKGSGVCEQYEYKCITGLCVSGPPLTQPNASCDATTGQCMPLTAGCKTNCDCAQGLLCTNRQCLAGTKAAYCCSKPGCPANESCQNPDGTSGTCPAPQTDCEKKGGQCVRQGMICPPNYTMDGSVSCGGSLSLNCCLPTTNPCATIKCQGPSCATDSSGACSTTLYTCDPTLGQCVPTTKTTKPYCSLSGTICTQFTPACSNNQCALKTSTVTLSCSQSGTSCLQITPSCASDQCAKTSQTIANSTCDAATGKCSPTQVACKTHCDCTQGMMCSNGQCFSGTAITYCCTKPGCLAGATCTNPDGTKGTCPTTKTDCEIKGGQCVVQGTACPSGTYLNTTVSCGSIRSLNCCLPNPCATIRCQGPTCATTSTGTCNETTYTCDPALGQCVPTTKTVATACSMSGTSCTQFTPVCSNNQCTAKTSTVSPTCRQSGTSCIQSAPTCSNNLCSAASRTIANSTCNTTTGQCSAISPTCKTHCDCTQGMMCSNGQCLIGTVSTYCCNKPGCPAGSSCTNPDGTKGTCPSSQTDCVQKGGQCVSQGSICPRGYQQNSALSCGGSLSLYCCVPII
ncbi:hypothetical protein L6R29_08305 [Myxococcota bacterium]|nr:hypothetical protein [Myxococcota bacterium]